MTVCNITVYITYKLNYSFLLLPLYTPAAEHIIIIAHTSAAAYNADDIFTPVDGATPFAQSIAAYTSGASAIVAPTDSRIGDAYKTLVSDIVKVSTGAMSAEDAINESLALVQQ